VFNILLEQSQDTSLVISSVQLPKAYLFVGGVGGKSGELVQMPTVSLDMQKPFQVQEFYHFVTIL